MTGMRRVLSLVSALVFALALMLPSLTVYAAPPPTVTGIAPGGGSVAGGTTLTITGTGFAAGVTVTVGGYAASAVALTGTTQITVNTPPHATGSASVIVKNPDAQSGTSPTTFTYTAIPPVIPAITEFSAGITASSSPFGIAAGPDGNLWFAESNAGKIGQITPGGTVTEYPTLTANSGPFGIAAGPDGNLWFTEQNGNKIGRITPSGTVTEYSIPTAGGSPDGIAAGPDGNLWFTETGTSKIGRITPAGAISEFSAGITASSAPAGIAAGPGGSLWFAEGGGDKIGQAMIAAPLAVTVATPRSGPTTGGTVVTLTGTGFLAGATVTFDGVAGTNVTVVSATQITVTTPAHPTAATVDVVVTNPGGGTDTLTHGYTYGTPNPVPPPRPPGSSGGGPPNPLPAPRPGGTIGGSAPNPVPAPRP